MSFFYTISIAGLTSNPTYGTTAQIGVELTASVTNWSSDPPASVAWQWYDGSGAISGATSATYTPVSGDDLEAIYATATPSDTYAPKNSAAYLVRYAPAVNTVAPVASGDTSLGDTISTSNGTWTGATGGSYSYQWQRDGVDISGATASTYDIVAADDAADLRCVVTYTNSGGAVSANSNAVTVDDFAAPAITGSPTISGTEQVGQTLTATAASVTGTPTPSRTWQWVNSASGDISGATSSTYTLQASDEGDTITVRQTETNGLGSDTAISAATGAIAAAPAVATITINSIGPQQSDGDVPASVTSSADVTAENVLFDAAESDPGAADFGGAGAPTYIDLDPVALTSGASTPEVALPNGLQGNFKWGVLPPGGGDADVAVSASFALDTTGSVLSPVSFTDDSAEGIDWAFTPDEDSAAVTGYRVSVWPDGTDPSDAEIASGTGSTATVTGTAAASVAESGNFASLGAGTYQPTVWYKDAFGNEVFETYSDVTVAAVSAGITPVLLDFVFVEDNASLAASRTMAADMSAHNGTDDIVIIWGVWGGSAGATLPTVTLDGNASAAHVTQTRLTANGPICGYTKFSAAAFAASSNVVFSGANMFDVGAAIYAIPPGKTVETLFSQSPSTRAGSDVSGVVTAGDAVLACQLVWSGVDGTFTGVTKDGGYDIRTDEWFIYGSAGNVSAGTLSITASGISVETAAISVRIY